MTETLNYEEMWNDLKQQVVQQLQVSVEFGKEDMTLMRVVGYMYLQEGVDLRDPNGKTTSAYVVTKLRELGELSDD